MANDDNKDVIDFEEAAMLMGILQPIMDGTFTFPSIQSLAMERLKEINTDAAEIVKERLAEQQQAEADRIAEDNAKRQDPEKKDPPERVDLEEEKRVYEEKLARRQPAPASARVEDMGTAHGNSKTIDTNANNPPRTPAQITDPKNATTLGDASRTPVRRA